MVNFYINISEDKKGGFTMAAILLWIGLGWLLILIMDDIWEYYNQRSIDKFFAKKTDKEIEYRRLREERERNKE